jgi:hypothetical protein
MEVASVLAPAAAGKRARALRLALQMLRQGKPQSAA